jgi:hypothetical protein
LAPEVRAIEFREELVVVGRDDIAALLMGKT